ncbi:CREG2 protein, partial [Crotophaga sulcirostris]|nr:CREG2 protein [Crotophaga sulcirostris]
WCWWLPALLWGGAGGYVVVSSVSWPLPEEGFFADELHFFFTEEALPALLEFFCGLWKFFFPASAYREDAALFFGPAAIFFWQGAAPSRMFSFFREGAGFFFRAGTARYLARFFSWGFVFFFAAHGKIQGMPYGNCLLLSDGPVNNSTGIPFFFVTPKDFFLADLLKNPVASFFLPEADFFFCSYFFSAFFSFFFKNLIDPEDPRFFLLTLMVFFFTVPPEEVEFAKQAMFSRHPVVRKWPRSYFFFFMKMFFFHIWFQSW